MTNTMAVDQYGNTYHGLGKHPRKALIARLGHKHVSKMYIDSTDGHSYHVGWIVGPHWCTVYNVDPMRVAS